MRPVCLSYAAPHSASLWEQRYWMQQAQEWQTLCEALHGARLYSASSERLDNVLRQVVWIRDVLEDDDATTDSEDGQAR